VLVNVWYCCMKVKMYSMSNARSLFFYWKCKNMYIVLFWGSVVFIVRFFPFFRTCIQIQWSLWLHTHRILGINCGCLWHWADHRHSYHSWGHWATLWQFKMYVLSTKKLRYMPRLILMPVGQTTVRHQQASRRQSRRGKCTL